MKINLADVCGYEELCHKYGLGELAAKVCAAQKLSDERLRELFEDNSLCDPFAAQGVREIVNRLQQAKANREKVLICGDYDADGICATAILSDALTRYGITNGFYIPNRFREGYGLHIHTIDMAKEKDYSLIITVDNGVKSIDALHHCKKCGIEVIVTDHHTMEGEIPCDFLLHPQLMGERFATLCGAGVALMLSRALLGDIKEHIVLAAVASVGDVMELWHETRAIVKEGICYLNEGCCLPIQSLSKEANTKWDVRKIAFQIVPKLNTTGRLADKANVNNTVRFLLMRDPKQIADFAKQMERLNQLRRSMSHQMQEAAQALIHERADFYVLYDESFHEGLSGLVAGKLCEQLQAPVVVFAKGKEGLKGSIRSNDSVDLRDFFADCPISLLAYGGHRSAAGIAIRTKDLDDLKQFIKEKMITFSKTQAEAEVTAIDCRMCELTVTAVSQLEALAPFGEGFPQPLFRIGDYHVERLRQLSQGRHVKWESLEHIDALYFNAKDVYAKYQGETRLSFLGTLAVNEYRHEKKVNILVREVIS